MTLATIRNARQVSPSDVTRLGKIGGHEYVALNGAEYTVRRLPHTPGDVGFEPDELDLVERVTTVRDGHTSNAPVHRKLTPVDPGTYAQLVAEQARQAAKLDAGARPGPINLLVAARLPAMRHYEPTIDGALSCLADLGAVVVVKGEDDWSVQAPAGKLASACQVWALAGRGIIRRHLGKPILCKNASVHGGKPPEAVAPTLSSGWECAACIAA